MTSDLDIHRSANELIKQYGEATDIEAAMRADECLASGDMEGEAVWLRIGKAIKELQRLGPGAMSLRTEHGRPRSGGAFLCPKGRIFSDSPKRAKGARAHDRPVGDCTVSDLRQSQTTNRGGPSES